MGFGVVYKGALACGALIAGMGVSVSVRADGFATAELSDIRFHVIDLDPSDDVEPTYKLGGMSEGHVYAAASERNGAPDEVQFSQGAAMLSADAGLANGEAIAGASAVVLRGGLFAAAIASGNRYQHANAQATFGSPRPDRDFSVGIDLAPHSMLTISMLGSVHASAEGLARCPNISDDASMFCESQHGMGAVHASLKYSYQSGFLSVSSDQFDMVAKGVTLTPIYDFPPEDEGFFLQIVDPAPDESVLESRRMYFTFSNTSPFVQHAELNMRVIAGASGGIPAVPEPSTMVFLAAGLAALGWRQRGVLANKPS